MAEWNVQSDEGNRLIGGDNGAHLVLHAGTLSGLSDAAEGDDGVAIQSLAPGTMLNVQTRNSEYRLLVLDGTDLDVLVRGGRLFPEAARVRLGGATAGGSAVKVGWMGLGLRLEMSVGGRRIITSRIRSITIDRVSGVVDG